MKKLFCIESDWDRQPQREKSILPLLQCIKGVYPEFDYIYRTANTKEEQIYCLKKFKSIRKQNNDFYTMVFCGHGRTGKFTEYSGQTRPVILDEISRNVKWCERRTGGLYRSPAVYSIGVSCFILYLQKAIFLFSLDKRFLSSFKNITYMFSNPIFK